MTSTTSLFHAPTNSTEIQSSSDDTAVETVFASFNMEALRCAVERYFDTKCMAVRKIAQGGYHLVLLVSLEATQLQPAREVVARLALPYFYRDKLLSEIATLALLEKHTTIPVPHVYFWNSDASNDVGAEYMVMEQIEGVPAYDIWLNFPLQLKCHFMDQLAHFLHELFLLRFNRIGSIYSSSGTSGHYPGFVVGPIVSHRWYRSLKGEPHRSVVPNPKRGPYLSSAEWLASLPGAHLQYLEHFRAESLAYAEAQCQHCPRNMPVGEAYLTKMQQLARIYYGPGAPRELTEGFTLWHNDFRLANIMVNPVTGNITGLIDWEATQTAPLWEAAEMPLWLLDYNEGGTLDGGEAGRAEKRALKSRFEAEMDKLDRSRKGVSWRTAETMGEPYRRFARLSRLHWFAISPDQLQWAEAALAWAQQNPGLPFPEPEDEY